MIEYQDKCRGFEKDAGDCDRMRKEIEVFRSEILTWEERHRHTEEELFACRKEVKVWEDKFLHKQMNETSKGAENLTIMVRCRFLPRSFLLHIYGQ